MISCARAELRSAETAWRYVGVALVACGLAGAPQAAAAPALEPEIVVVALTPIPGVSIPREQLPAAVHILEDADLDRTLIPSLTGALFEDLPGATIDDASGNIFQPSILFDGFSASPVQGDTQGLAVYVDGARFNEPFGDTVNWDLLPPSAIRRVSVEGASPLFGLNALGGSVNVLPKNGFSSPGGAITAYGGSYGRGAGTVEYGRQDGAFATYIAAQVTHDSGYRQTSTSDLYQLYGDFGWRDDRATLHLSLTADDNALGNPGASPVQLLDVDRRAAFTAPNVVFNKYLSVNLRGTDHVSDILSVQGVLYDADLTQRIVNGSTVDFTPCTDGSGNLCNGDGTYVTGRGAQPIADTLNGGPYSGNNLQGTNSNAFGGSAQIADTGRVLGHANIAVLGASVDAGDVGFSGRELLGGLSAQRLFIGPGITLDDPSEGIVPTRLSTTTRYYGVFASEVFSINKALSVDVGARLNVAEISLLDRIGTTPVYRHAYQRLNPGAGLTYQFGPALGAYASYTQANRAPTAVELSCAGPHATCSLPNFFLGDPPLKQVVAQAVEAGLRGTLAGSKLEWDANYFRTRNDNDIILVPDLVQGLSYFQNAGETLRQGVELNATWRTPRLLLRAGYAYTSATFQSALTLSSPNNPFAHSVTGTIDVHPGNRLPGVPQHRITLVVQYAITPRWTAGGSASFTSDQYFFGDEANLAKPLAPYAVLNVNATYKLTDAIHLFGVINNALDRHYNTYGTFSSPEGVPFPEVSGGVTNTRVASPALPLTAFAGMRATF